METSEFGDALLVTEIQAGPHADKAFVAVCLAMDLISSGFFRLGGFSTRGYGVARCTPLALESMGDLSTALEHGTPPASRSLTGLNHGLNLAREMGFADPLGHLETWLRQLTAPQKSKEAEHALT